MEVAFTPSLLLCICDSIVERIQSQLLLLHLGHPKNDNKKGQTCNTAHQEAIIIN